MGGRSVNVDSSRDVRKNLGSTHYHIWALPFSPGMDDHMGASSVCFGP
jgi:hypothetical protein